MRAMVFCLMSGLALALLGGCANTSVQTKKTRLAVERLDLRYRSLTSRDLPVTGRYLTDRSAFRRRANETRSLIRDYVQITAMPDEQQPNEWHYAALYRSAHATEALALAAKRMSQLYRSRGKSGYARGFGTLHRRFMKVAYKGYMLVLFAGWYSHKKHPSVAAHNYNQSSWLRRANTSRCTRKDEAGMRTSTHHDNLVWSMLRSQSGTMGAKLTGSQQRDLLSRFMKERRYKLAHCP